MRLDRVVGWVRRWARLYTAGLPDDVAARRREEIASDLDDHVTHARSCGVADRSTAAEVASRTFRGAAADIAWRTREAREATSSSGSRDRARSAGFTRSARRVVVVVAVALAIPLAATFLSDEMNWSFLDFALVGVLVGVIAGCVEAAIQRRGSALVAGAVAGLGLTAAVGGELDDAPGLILLGASMIAGGAAIALRRIRVGG